MLEGIPTASQNAFCIPPGLLGFIDGLLDGSFALPEFSD